MDNSNFISTGSLLGILSISIHVIEKIYAVINHKRIRSKCCGFDTEVSLDVENTTPPGENTSVNLPKITLAK